MLATTHYQDARAVADAIAAEQQESPSELHLVETDLVEVTLRLPERPKIGGNPFASVPRPGEQLKDRGHEAADDEGEYESVTDQSETHRRTA